MKRNCITVVCAIVVGLVAARQASADPIPGFYALQVTVSAGNGPNSASETWTIPHGVVSSETAWDVLALENGGAPYQLTDSNGTVLGTVMALTASVAADPVAALHFSVEAGASDTPFTFTSMAVPVSPSLGNAPAYATAGVTVTDGGDNNLATLTGSLPGGKIFEANYNGPSVFHDLLTGPVTATTSTTLLNDAYGTVPIVGPVSSISSQFSFTLSANDLASGTSRFSVTPEPASVTLLAISGVLSLLAIAWRRK